MRLQRSVNHLFEQLTEQKIVSEIIFVNYNPLPEKPDINEFINWPKSNDFVSIIIITVAEQMHNKIVKEYAVRDIPVLEFIAKNIGVRRSKGEFILSTNADIMIHKSIFKQFKYLDKAKFYRANRFDFTSTDTYIETEKIMNITRIWLKGFYYDFDLIKNPNLQYGLAKFNRYKYYLDYYFKQSINPFIRLIWGTDYHHKAEMKYHCHCSGDFMLMHRNAWHQLRGYWERSYITLHVDALLVIQAASSGLKEHIFNYPVYHQEHERRYNHSSENNDYRKEYFQFQTEAKQMLNRKKATIYNDEYWGLAIFDLPQKEL